MQESGEQGRILTCLPSLKDLTEILNGATAFGEFLRLDKIYTQLLNDSGKAPLTADVRAMIVGTSRRMLAIADPVDYALQRSWELAQEFSEKELVHEVDKYLADRPLGVEIRREIFKRVEARGGLKAVAEEGCTKTRAAVFATRISLREELNELEKGVLPQASVTSAWAASGPDSNALVTSGTTYIAAGAAIAASAAVTLAVAPVAVPAAVVVAVFGGAGFLMGMGIGYTIFAFETVDGN